MGASGPLPGGQQGAQGRVQDKEAVQVHRSQRGRGAGVVWPRDAQGWAAGVVGGLAMRHNHIEGIGRAAQEDDDERIATGRGLGGREGQARHPAGPDRRGAEHGRGEV